MTIFYHARYEGCQLSFEGEREAQGAGMSDSALVLPQGGKATA